MKNCFWIFFVLLLSSFCIADDWDEFKVKREMNFTFVSEPTVSKKEDNLYLVVFETASFCDVTVVVEEKATGRIVRHLASGVLGVNAPIPFAKNSKKQELVWDSKDDKDSYVTDIQNYQIRVSLGLEPKYEKDLFVSNEKRYGDAAIRFASTKDGIYTYDGGGSWDFVRMYDFAGKYIKTIYPISAQQMQKTKGIELLDLPDKSGKFPHKTNFLQNSFFKDSSNSGEGVNLVGGGAHYGMYGKGASFLAVNNQRVAIGMGRVHFIGLENQELKESFYGPLVVESVQGGKKDQVAGVPPLSAALSPDGNKVYFTGYHYGNFRATATEGITYNGNWDTFNLVNVLDVSSGKISVFKGQAGLNKSGNDNESFHVPIHVHVDEQNRVYVADYLNDRVQIFDQSGKFLKSISSPRPSYVTVLHKSKEIVVGSFGVEVTMEKGIKKVVAPARITFFGTFEKVAKGQEVLLPKEYDLSIGNYLYNGDGLKVSMAVADDSGEINVWLSTEKPKENKLNTGKIPSKNIEIFQIKNKKLEMIKDFDQIVKKDLVYGDSFAYGRKRIYVNPKTGNIFHATTMFGYVGKAFSSVIEIDVKTGKQQVHKLPFDAEDINFDSEGYIYLKSASILARFEVESWREVPFDYGFETKAFTSSSSDRVVGDVISGVKLPFTSGWHHGGMYISPKGYIVTSGPYMHSKDDNDRNKDDVKVADERSFLVYPGRAKFSKVNHLVHIFDKYGKEYKMDLLSGLTDVYGLGIDQELNVYVMSGATRVLNGEAYKNLHSGTVLKLPKEGVKALTVNGSVPLTKNEIPQRPADVSMGSSKFWVNGAEWFYGGVGFAGKNTGIGCACFNARMAFDYLNRSFAPELERYSVAVLDSAGNLICHIGKYGNIDSQGPKSKNAIGGDEVTMVHGAYLATETDKYLYISDPANDRIVKVKLGYHENKLIGLPAK